MASKERFWETKRLDEMTSREWESLCDGCAQCCRLKFQDGDTGEITTTPVVCGLLDMRTCRCTHYEERHRLVDDCVELTTENVEQLEWMPETCAYRLLANGKKLFDWHPLISGDPKSVHKAGISVKGQVVSERDVDPEDLLAHVVKWRS